MKITLPKPPSVNHLYRTFRRGNRVMRVVGAEGEAWFNGAGLIVKSKLKLRQPIEGDIELSADLYTCRHQDLDNICKATLDMLERAGIVNNDAQVTSILLHKYKVPHVADERLEVEVYEL